ncbi:hypothetical protein [Flavihumibacter petaseus]|uniref:Uncharacterized protein n=1 Tax=Flavihumibacter petaseus NBRC 106054 TaxID=1220578 RepID=A0A0E9N2I2_9BACT|nr:hypothetical protein [Flavihumibacter petaseus]GAO43535.1 hypothetical protein FPE01S_02_06400 [Flavihumibacter petaseus NBRC 106054]
MKTLILMEPWPDTREKLKEIENHLTDEDLDYEPGHEDDLLKRLAAILNKDMEAVKVWIESVSANKAKAS